MKIQAKHKYLRWIHMIPEGISLAPSALAYYFTTINYLIGAREILRIVTVAQLRTVFAICFTKNVPICL